MNLSVDPANAAIESLLPAVARIVGFIRRRHRLSADEGEEFASYVKLKLVERGASILNGFQGRSTFETYLSVIVQRFFLDYRAEQWGRWRSSAVARSLGPEAVRLEEMIHREGLSSSQAIRTLRLEHQVAMSETELEALAAQLPPRAARRAAEEQEPIEPVAEPDGDPVVAAEERATAERIESALRAVMASLPEQDRLIVRLHFLDGVTLASVAGVLRVPQKPLYRRVERILKSLREGLESEGIDRRTVASLIGRAEFGIGIRQEPPASPGIRPAGPSMER